MRDGACLRCIWPEATRDGLVGNCAEAGVLGPVPGVFGSLQALEALKCCWICPDSSGDELLVHGSADAAVSRMKCAPAPRLRAAGRACAHAIPAAATLADAPAHWRSTSIRSMTRAAAGYTVIDIREPEEVAEEPTPGANARHHARCSSCCAAMPGLMPEGKISAGVRERPTQSCGAQDAARARLHATWSRLPAVCAVCWRHAAASGFRDRSRAAPGR